MRYFVVIFTILPYCSEQTFCFEVGPSQKGTHIVRTKKYFDIWGTEIRNILDTGLCMWHHFFDGRRSLYTRGRRKYLIILGILAFACPALHRQ